MPDQSGQHWRQQHQYYNSLPVPPGWQQQSQAEQMPGTQGIDVSTMFAPDSHNYQPYSGGGHASIPPIYHHHDSWGSDMDMGTPSTTGFPNETQDTFPQQPPQPFGHLRIPAYPASAHSPQSSHSGLSPSMAPAQLSPDRPQYSRSLTDPTQKRRATAPAAPGAKLPSSDDEDEDFVPTNHNTNDSTAKSSSKGSRKRQRIPHTAVERRYRENLNAHLEKLRQTVPALAPRKGPGGTGKEAEGVKPSKCEILSGAIDYIGAVERENMALKSEVRALRERFGEYEGWYRH